MTATAHTSENDGPDPAITHESLVFLMDVNGCVRPIDHERYVALARGETSAPDLAGRRLILVDWYVRFFGGRPDSVVNESCSWVVFDSRGFMDVHGARSIAAAATPNELQWAQVRDLAFPVC